MNRIEVIGNATLYLGDCRDVLPTLGKVDAVVTDPPYGLNVEYTGFDDSAANVEQLAKEWLPLARSAADRVLFTPGIASIWFYPKSDWVLCWAISGAGGRSPWGFACWSPILVYGKDPYLAAGKGARPDLIFKNETSEKNGHPCPKPVGFMKLLVERCSFADHVICDPFMGSGTTGVACHSLGRKFIGIERDPGYFDIACKRIEQVQRQSDLFIEAAA